MVGAVSSFVFDREKSWVPFTAAFTPAAVGGDHFRTHRGSLEPYALAHFGSLGSLIFRGIVALLVWVRGSPQTQPFSIRLGILRPQHSSAF
jgi:hypothetical protein